MSDDIKTKESVKPKTSLVQLTNLMAMLQSQGYEVHISGIGDTNVELVFDNCYVIRKYSIPLNNV